MKHTGRLLRVFGVVFGLAAVVGSVVGQGILRAPGAVAQASDSSAVLIGLWALGALLALLSAAPFVELGTAIPNAGGGIAYAERAFGRRAGIVVSIMIIISYLATTALLCFVVGEFLVRLGVGGGAIGPGALALLSLALFCFINAFGTRASGYTQIGLSSLKGAVLIGLVVVLFAQPGLPVAPDAPAVIAPEGLAAFGTAILLIVGTYNGWGDLVVYGEEIADPGRAIPRAMFGGIVGVAVLYLLVNLAFMHVLTPAQMAGSELVAADAAAGVFGNRGDVAFTLFGVISVGAIANLSVMTNSRLVFAAARDGMLPRPIAWVDARGTPMMAMLGSSAVAALFLLSGTYLTLSSTSVALMQAFFVTVILCAIRLRRKEPDLARPWSVPWSSVLLPLALVLNVVLLIVFIVQDPWNALLGFAIVAVLAGGYFLFAGKGAAPVVDPAAEGAEP